MRLRGKVALITGATQGLGEGIACRFAREAAQVVINGRSVQRGESVVAKLRGLGADAHFIRADVSQYSEATSLVQQAAAHFGRLDILINNAQAVPDLIPADETRNTEYLEQ